MRRTIGIILIFAGVVGILLPALKDVVQGGGISHNLLMIYMVAILAGINLAIRTIYKICYPMYVVIFVLLLPILSTARFGNGLERIYHYVEVNVMVNTIFIFVLLSVYSSILFLSAMHPESIKED